MLKSAFYTKFNSKSHCFPTKHPSTDNQAVQWITAQDAAIKSNDAAIVNNTVIISSNHITEGTDPDAIGKYCKPAALLA